MHKKIGKYEIGESLGFGGQASVYKAVDTEHDKRTVALKLIKVDAEYERTAIAEEAFKRFNHESTVIAHLDHPQIAQVFDYGLDKKHEVAWNR